MVTSPDEEFQLKLLFVFHLCENAELFIDCKPWLIDDCQYN